jgi:transposase-like protein
MGKIKRRFDIQFKIQLCQAIEGGSLTQREACQEYQVSRSTLESWLAKYHRGDLEAGSPNRARQMEREMEKLRAKVGELTMTIDLLKKAQILKLHRKSDDLSIITSRNLGRFQKLAKQQESRPLPTITGPRKK